MKYHALVRNTDMTLIITVSVSIHDMPTISYVMALKCIGMIHLLFPAPSEHLRDVNNVFLVFTIQSIWRCVSSQTSTSISFLLLFTCIFPYFCTILMKQFPVLTKPLVKNLFPDFFSCASCLHLRLRSTCVPRKYHFD